MTNHEGPKKFIEFKQVNDRSSILLKYGVTIVIILAIVIFCYGFFEIKKQLTFLSDKIEEVKIDEMPQTSSNQDEQTTTDNSENENNKSILGQWNNIRDKEEGKSINCKDYLKLISVAVSLKQKIETGESFEKEIVLLSLAVKDEEYLDKSVTMLEPYSASGVPNLESLISEFNALQNELIIASRLSDESPNWKYTLLKIFSKFIFVKKIGDRALHSGGIDQIVAKVNLLLQEEDIQGAIAELQKITNPLITKLVSIWVEHANDNLEVNKTLFGLYQYVFNNLNCEFKEPLTTKTVK
jgi:hypothetical protein